MKLKPPQTPKKIGGGLLLSNTVNVGGRLPAHPFSYVVFEEFQISS